MVMCIVFAYQRNFPRGTRSRSSRPEDRLRSDLGSDDLLIILGGILSGIFTATESASIACRGSSRHHGHLPRLQVEGLPTLMHRTVKTVTMVMILIGFAASFGYIITLMQLPARITEMFTTLSDNRYVILLCINVLLLLLGTLMDMAPLILILTPILLPVVKALGVDPVHFGMIMMVNLGIGLITPPVGSVLFVASAVGNIKIEAVVRAMLPFYVGMFGVLMAVTYLPEISLWLPRLMGLSQ